MRTTQTHASTFLWVQSNEITLLVLLVDRFSFHFSFHICAFPRDRNFLQKANQTNTNSGAEQKKVEIIWNRNENEYGKSSKMMRGQNLIRKLKCFQIVFFCQSMLLPTVAVNVNWWGVNFDAISINFIQCALWGWLTFTGLIDTQQQTSTTKTTKICWDAISCASLMPNYGATRPAPQNILNHSNLNHLWQSFKHTTHQTALQQTNASLAIFHFIYYFYLLHSLLPIVEPFFPFIRFNAHTHFSFTNQIYFLHHFVLISFRFAIGLDELTRGIARAYAPPRKHYSTIDRANDFFLFLQQ